MSVRRKAEALDQEINTDGGGERVRSALFHHTPDGAVQEGNTPAVLASASPAVGAQTIGDHLRRGDAPCAAAESSCVESEYVGNTSEETVGAGEWSWLIFPQHQQRPLLPSRTCQRGLDRAKTRAART